MKTAVDKNESQPDKDVIIKEKIKHFISDEEAVVSKWIRDRQRMKLREESWIILHSGKPLHNHFFHSDKETRNYIKMQYPKRRFTETKENIFIDKNFGGKFEIIRLKNDNI